MDNKSNLQITLKSEQNYDSKCLQSKGKSKQVKHTVFLYRYLT